MRRYFTRDIKSFLLGAVAGLLLSQLPVVYPLVIVGLVLLGLFFLWTKFR
jgi:hypothetical protein